MKILAETVRGLCKNEQLDDWSYEGDDLVAKAAASKVRDYDFLLLVHAIVEAYLCRRHGILESDVSDFDAAHLESEDPGYEPGSPYRREHHIATGNEKYLAEAMGIDWADYERHQAHMLEKK